MKFNMTGSFTNPDDTQVKESHITKSSETDLKYVEDMASFLATMNGVVVGLAFFTAENQWANGYCVEVQVPELGAGTKTVQPNSETPFTAKVRHKFEDTELPLPVIATLSDGQVSVNPSGSKVPAPATFTYKAADKEGQKATVHLETRSKRGIATLDVKFKTKRQAYELEFDSIFVTNTFTPWGTTGPINVTQHVHAVVPLEWSEQDQTYTGQAPLDYVLFDVPPIIGIGGDAGYFLPCPNQTTATGGTFRVLQLKGLMDTNTPQPGQTPVSSLELTIDPGTTVESAVPVCPPPIPPQPPGFFFPLSTWSQNFASAHNRETLVGTAPYIIKDWGVGSGNIVAVKNYVYTNLAGAPIGKITENTTITLVQK
jgi:hypothetical protein